MADETAAKLAKLRKAMVKMQRAGRQREFDALASAYASLKAQQMEQAEQEHRAPMRARRAAQRPVEAQERVNPWRLPAGFGTSPLAQQRAREGRREGGPQVPARGHLSPWRGGWHPASEQIWRPGR